MVFALVVVVTTPLSSAFLRLRQGRDTWILDADLKSAFDKVDHRFLLDTIGPVPGRELIKQWLKAGYVEAEMFHATSEGTPQGGSISPLLLNIALNMGWKTCCCLLQQLESTSLLQAQDISHRLNAYRCQPMATVAMRMTLW